MTGIFDLTILRHMLSDTRSCKLIAHRIFETHESTALEIDEILTIEPLPNMCFDEKLSVYVMYHGISPSCGRTEV